MLIRQFPSQVDYQSLARENGKLTGAIPVQAFERLASIVSAVDRNGVANEVHADLGFSVSACRRNPEISCVAIQGSLLACLELRCQTCLAPLDHEMDFSFYWEVVPADSAREGEEDMDVIVWPFDRELAVRDLIEDEIILDLPMVPRHDVCQIEIDANSVVGENVSVNAGEQKNMPFADLKKVLKKRSE